MKNEKPCLDHLMEQEFYQKYSSDQNTCHRDTTDKEVKKLKRNRYITNFEESMLLQGNHSPIFYSNPKLHNSFLNFLELRPICSGSHSCSKNSS